MKIQNDGTLIWSHSFGGSSGDICYSVEITSQNNYVMTGWKSSATGNNHDLYLIKTNSDGVMIWEKTFNSSSFLNAGTSVIEDENGDKIGIRKMGVLGQSFDHRAFDGAYAASFLKEVKTIIEDYNWQSEI